MTQAARRLLIVDDEPDFASFVGEVGKEAGYEIRIVTRAGEFELAYRDFEPTVVLMDIVMPDVDGIELVRWLAKIKSKAVVIVVTGFNPLYAETARILADLEGLTLVKTLAKPLKVEDLRAALE